MSEKRAKEKRQLDEIKQSLAALERMVREGAAFHRGSEFWGWISVGVSILALTLDFPPLVKLLLLVVAWISFYRALRLAFIERKLGFKWNVFAFLIIGISLYVLWANFGSKGENTPRGSLQFSRLEVPKHAGTIAAGHQFGVNWYFMNPGPERVLNVVQFSRSFVEHVDEEVDYRVKVLFEKQLELFREKYQSGEVQGNGVDARNDFWISIQTPVLAKEEVVGVFSGTTRIYFVAWIGWVDKQGVSDSLYRCQSLQWENLREVRRQEDLVWHNCIVHKKQS